MEKRRQEILNKINQASELLSSAMLLLIEENKGESQFDYVTSSKLSNEVDYLLSLTNRINKITYQE